MNEVSTYKFTEIEINIILEGLANGVVYGKAALLVASIHEQYNNQETDEEEKADG